MNRDIERRIERLEHGAAQRHGGNSDAARELWAKLDAVAERLRGSPLGLPEPEQMSVAERIALLPDAERVAALREWAKVRGFG